ncbi:MAG TPA: anti-sigma factor [Flavisolibacter sp.]|jgi:hypothetical protein|nr:anti-sigma factor [Flavisolibacter sp.]
MNSDLQNKLQQFSANPPDGTWDKIANALDAEESYAQRLFAYEEEPPAANWQRIEQQLEEQPEGAKVVPIHKRFTRPMRYVAVASILAIILVTITLTTERTEAGALEAAGTTAVPTAKIPVTTGTVSTTPNTNTVRTFNPDARSPQNKSNEGLAGSQVRTTSPNAGKRSISTTPINASLQDYVTYNDGNGKVMKVSRKMETYINCKDGDLQCKQRLQQLRQKMAAKAMTTDFTGILEMLQQLQ